MPFFGFLFFTGLLLPRRPLEMPLFATRRAFCSAVPPLGPPSILFPGFRAPCLWLASASSQRRPLDVFTLNKNMVRRKYDFSVLLLREEGAPPFLRSQNAISQSRLLSFFYTELGRRLAPPISGVSSPGKKAGQATASGDSVTDVPFPSSFWSSSGPFLILEEVVVLKNGSSPSLVSHSFIPPQRVGPLPLVWLLSPAIESSRRTAEFLLACVPQF